MKHKETKMSGQIKVDINDQEYLWKRALKSYSDSCEILEEGLQEGSKEIYNLSKKTHKNHRRISLSSKRYLVARHCC